MHNDVDCAYSARQYTFLNTHGTRCSKNRCTRFSTDVQNYTPVDYEYASYSGNHPDGKPRRWVPFACTRYEDFVSRRASMTRYQDSRGDVHCDVVLELKVVEHWASIIARR